MGAVLGSTLVEVEELVVTEVSDDSSPGFKELVFPFVPGFPPQAVRARAMAPNATAGAMNLRFFIFLSPFEMPLLKDRSKKMQEKF